MGIQLNGRTFKGLVLLKPYVQFPELGRKGEKKNHKHVLNFHFKIT